MGIPTYIEKMQWRRQISTDGSVVFTYVCDVGLSDTPGLDDPFKYTPDTTTIIATAELPLPPSRSAIQHWPSTCACQHRLLHMDEVMLVAFSL